MPKSLTPAKISQLVRGSTANESAKLALNYMFSEENSFKEEAHLIFSAVPTSLQREFWFYVKLMEKSILLNLDAQTAYLHIEIAYLSLLLAIASISKNPLSNILLDMVVGGSFDGSDVGFIKKSLESSKPLVVTDGYLAFKDPTWDSIITGNARSFSSCYQELLNHRDREKRLVDLFFDGDAVVPCQPFSVTGNVLTACKERAGAYNDKFKTILRQYQHSEDKKAPTFKDLDNYFIKLPDKGDSNSVKGAIATLVRLAENDSGFRCPKSMLEL